MLRRATPMILVAALMTVMTVPAAAGGGGGGGTCMSAARPKGEVSVLVMDMCFRPDAIAIEAGQTVRWELAPESSPHTVTFNKAVDSGELDSFAVKFRQPGSYAYVCAYHPGMAGSVEVRGAAIDGHPLEVVPTSDFTPTASTSADEAQLASSSTNELLIKIDHVTALLLVLFGLSIGAGSVTAARLLRGR